MSAQYFRVGRPTDLEATNKIVKKHAEVKEHLVEELTKLAAEAEGLVLKQIEQELNETWWDGLGRGVIVVGGVISLLLLPFAVPSVSAVTGIGACVVGYVLVGKSIYECRANSKERIEKMKQIYSSVKKELDCYQESQKKVFTDLESYDFTQGKDFKGNMGRMKTMIENAENSLKYGCCDELEDFLKKVKTQYLKLEPAQQNTLESEKFLMDMQDLMKIGAGLIGSNTATAGLVGDIFTATTHNIGGGVGAAIGTWGNVFQGINILINGAFLVSDIKKYGMLRRMQKDWKEEDKEEIKKENRFKVYFELKDEINQIRDEIMSSGY